MKTFGVLILLVAALAVVIAVPNPHGYGPVACDDDGKCLVSLYERAIMGSTTQIQNITAPSSSSHITVTMTIDTYTTVPCSDETGIASSTTTVSKHSTSTEFLTMTITSSNDIASILGTSTALNLVPLSTSRNFSGSAVASPSSSVTTTSIDILSTFITSGLVSSSSTSTLSVVPFSTTSTVSEAVSSSSSSVGGVESTSVTTSMAYISPSYGPGPSTALPAYSGVAIFSTTSSVDAISTTPLSSSQAALTIVTQPVIPIAASTGAGSTTLTTCSTSTRTTTVNIGYNPPYATPNYAGALSSILASMSLISEQYYSATPTAIFTATPSLAALSTEDEACSALSTIWVTITGTTNIAPTAAPTGSTGTIPANPLDSQSRASSGNGNGSSSTANTGATLAAETPSTLASTDAISASESASALISNIPMATESAFESAFNSGTQPMNNSITTSASVTLGAAASGVGSNTNSMAPAARGDNHVNMALVMCFIGAMAMFAV